MCGKRFRHGSASHQTGRIRQVRRRRATALPPRLNSFTASASGVGGVDALHEVALELPDARAGAREHLHYRVVDEHPQGHWLRGVELERRALHRTRQPRVPAGEGEVIAQTRLAELDLDRALGDVERDGGLLGAIR